MTDGPKTAGALSWFSMVGPALTVFRRKAGFSIAEVAGRAKVGKSQLSRYENGRELPRFESLARILDALSTEPLSFFYLVHALGQDVPEERRLCVELLLMQSGRKAGGVKLAERVLELFQILLQGLDESEGRA